MSEKERPVLFWARKWNVARLAKVANLSPFHLCHVFRDSVGTSIYDYVLHERLAHTLDAVLDCGDDLTAIALDAGFASHRGLSKVRLRPPPRRAAGVVREMPVYSHARGRRRRRAFALNQQPIAFAARFRRL